MADEFTPLSPEQVAAALAEAAARGSTTPSKQADPNTAVDPDAIVKVLGIKPPPPEPPKNATEAKARLEKLQADPEWRGRYLAGDVEANREIKVINELIANGGD